MVIKFKRKLYPRGGSYETTIPIQMLFSSDMTKKQIVIFEYDPASNKWFIDVKPLNKK